jgi:hypothetical protein
VIKSIRKEKKAFEENIATLFSGFENFRLSANVPPSSGFSISFIFPNGTAIDAGQKNVSEDVLSKTVQIDYVDENASFSTGGLTIRIWGG